MQKHVSLLFQIALVSMLLVGPASWAGEMSDAGQAIAKVNQEFVQAFSSGDAAGVAALYTEDAQAFPPNGDLVSGREAIQELWKDFIASGPLQISLTSAELEAFGDTAYEVGNYTLEDASGTRVDQGKYIVIWKRRDGQWKLYRDIWNSNQPAVAPETPSS